jgi:hypothetical protein
MFRPTRRRCGDDPHEKKKAGPRKVGCGRSVIPAVTSCWIGDCHVGTANSPRCSRATGDCCSPRATRPSGLRARPRGGRVAWLLGPHQAVFFEGGGERPRTAERILRTIPQLYRLERQWDEQAVVASARRCVKNTLRCPFIGCGNSPSRCVHACCPTPDSAALAPISSITGSRLARTRASARPGSTTTSSKAPSDPRPSGRRTGCLSGSRRRTAISHHLLHRRFLPAPRQAAVRVYA